MHQKAFNVELSRCVRENVFNWRLVLSPPTACSDRDRPGAPKGKPGGAFGYPANAAPCAVILLYLRPECDASLQLRPECHSVYLMLPVFILFFISFYPVYFQCCLVQVGLRTLIPVRHSPTIVKCRLWITSAGLPTHLSA